VDLEHDLNELKVTQVRASAERVRRLNQAERRLFVRLLVGDR
jgi:hypothetical protein